MAPLLLRAWLLMACLTLLGAAAPVAAADSEPAPHAGEALYQTNCAGCHDQPFYKAPSRMFIGALGPKNVLRVLNEGSMAQQAVNIDPAGRVAIAEYLTGKRLSDMVDPPLPPVCDAAHGFDPALIPVSAGWGWTSGTRGFNRRIPGVSRRTTWQAWR